MTVAVLTVLLAAAAGAAAFFAVRYLLLRRSLRQVDRELGEVIEHLEDNRIVHLPRPDAELEALLGTVNRALAGIRQQAIIYDRREAQLKTQVESISHDLRTPLTAIVGYLSFVDEGELDADTRASLDAVRRKADALQRLVAQFYELSQLRGEDVRLERQEVDVRRMLRESVAGQYRLLTDRGLDVQASVPEHPVRVRADANGLERVIENLVHNAGKYARSAFAATLADGPEGGRVTVAFENDVDGFVPSDLERLFEPFYIADGARTSESSGLGLAIARSLAERMGGALEAKLEERDGVQWLRFELVLEACLR